jgi:hypothetical protein
MLGLSDTQQDNAEPSAAAANFGNAAPFRRQTEAYDPVRNAIFIGVGVVLLVFLGSMIAVLMMHAPSL